VRERTAELEETQIEILERLALAAEYRDDDTGEHTKRVGQMSAEIARGLGLPPAEVELIRRAAPLHDVGKIAIPDSILLKPGRLTPEEFEQMKTHTTLGSKMLSGGRFPLLQRAEEIALTHHERWEGTGYIGLAGDSIPLAGRIVAVADVFDALTSARPYKTAWPRAEAVEEIRRQSGRQFDPRVVEAFLKIVEHETL
jgi:putative two-component system response regulator